MPSADRRRRNWRRTSLFDVGISALRVSPDLRGRATSTETCLDHGLETRRPRHAALLLMMSAD